MTIWNTNFRYTFDQELFFGETPTRFFAGEGERPVAVSRLEFRVTPYPPQELINNEGMRMSIRT